VSDSGTYCHTCGRVFDGGWPESHDHAADEHRDLYLNNPGALIFTDVDSVAALLLPRHTA
jgi:hypothetical protein